MAALALVPSMAQAAAPPGFVGLQSWNDPTKTNFAGMKNSKVSTFRMQLSWASVEPNKPLGGCDSANGCKHEPYRWGRYDAIFNNAALNGVRVMPVLLGSPSWAASKQQNPPMHPSHRQAFYDFAEAAADRYGPSSSFWRDRGLNGAAVGARDWQVWNEVNLKNYWNDRPSPTQYNAMVRGTHAAVRAGDSYATTVLAGLPWGNHGQTPPEFWKSMFKADPRIFKYFSSFAIHPYARTPSIAVDSGVRPAASTVRSLTPTYKRRLWITEMGWATPRPDGRFEVSESLQASNLKSFYDKVLAVRTPDRLNGAIWFSLQDKSGAEWYNRTGLLKANGSTKPSWARLKCVTGAPGCK